MLTGLMNRLRGVVSRQHFRERVHIDGLAAKGASFDKCAFIYRGGDFTLIDCYLEDITIHCCSIADIQKFVGMVEQNIATSGTYWAVNGMPFDRSEFDYSLVFTPFEDGPRLKLPLGSY